jgi:hypothetical protein
MRYEFHPEAELELYEAALRYETEVPDLGRRFGDEVERVVHLMLEHPELGKLTRFFGILFLRKFPFSVVCAGVLATASSRSLTNCRSRRAKRTRVLGGVRP